MAKLPLERRAAALKANLKRRKLGTVNPAGDPPKNPEKLKEKGEAPPSTHQKADPQG